jgi:hypothetical protein
VLSLAEGYLVSQSDDANAGLSSASPSSKVVLTGGVGATGASLKGAGLVKAGGTTISGATGSWQAVVATGNVAITVDAITGTDAALVADANTGAITIGDNAAATTTLTVTSLSVNILAGGSIVIPFPVSGGNENVFKLANSGASLRGLNITGNGGPAISGITSATVVGVGTAGNPGSADAGNFISVADGNTAATITGSASTSDVTIDKTTAITAAAI